MMQHVATSKSEIAAFATGKESNVMASSESNAQFGMFLQDQKLTDPVVVNYKTSQQTNDKVKNASASLANEDKAIQSKTAGSVAENTNSEPTSTASQDNISAESKGESTGESSGDDENISGENVSKKSEDESSSALSSNQSDEKSTDDSSKVVADEWVLLIDSLKRLASKDDSSSASSKELETENTDWKLSEPAEDGSFDAKDENSDADNIQILLDGSALANGEDQTKQNNPDLISNKQGEQTTSTEVVQGAEQRIAKFVDDALTQLLDTKKPEELVRADITQKTAELLLEQPNVLKALMAQLQGSSQKSAADEQQTSETIAKMDISKGAIQTNQQLETVAQVDLTLTENKKLLRALVVETETEIDSVKLTTKLAKTDFTDVPENNLPNKQVEAGVNQVVSSELLEQEVQIIDEAASNQIKVNSTENQVSQNSIQNLLNLTESKLNKVLESIAQRVMENKTPSGTITSEQLAEQIVTPKSAQAIVSIEPAIKDFIAALKTGVEEYKNQLSQGREPGIDLKALVAEAFAKSADPATVAKAPVNLEQIVSSVSHVLDMAQLMSRTIDERHEQLYSATLRDVAQVQGEQSKSLQFNQLETKFEKAVNITKPEGHQQLAEKVRWMVNTKNLVADIRLDPAELGSVHVKVAVSGESATVNFVVQSQLAKEAVDNATPKLREMLAEKGIELGQSSVEQESKGQGSQEEGEFSEHGSHNQGLKPEVEERDQVLAQQSIVNGAVGGIDYFV